MSAHHPVGRGSTARWAPSIVLTAGLVLGASALLIGALTGRADVAALGVAPLLSSVWARARRPITPMGVELRSPRQHTGSGDLQAPVLLHTPIGMSAARVRVSGPGTRATEHLVRTAPDRPREVTVGTVSARTGERRVFQIDVVGLGANQAIASDVVTVGPMPVLVLPRPRGLAELPLPPHLLGLVGPHDARRIGDGTELHDVNLFAPGDRLRRIDWRATARRGVVGDRLQDLYVRRTQSTAVATVVLVIDSRDEVGPDIGSWAGGRELLMSDATSLDIAREAAASLARAYLAQGDRVGVEDLGLRRRPVPPASGRRHLERITRRLAMSAPERASLPRVRAPQVPSGALVVVLSTFLDDGAMDVALLWRHTGHRVIVVDVLPTVGSTAMTSREAIAFRLVSLRREDRLTAMRRWGIGVVRWNEATPASARSQLSVLARQRHGAHP